MKHLFVLLLAFFLAGCTAEAPDPTTSPPPPPQVTDSTEPEPFTQPTVLRSTRALAVYDVGIADLRGIYPMGTDMVLISGGEETLLTVLSDNRAEITAQKTLPCSVHPEDGTMQINENGIAYYDRVQNAIVYLNTDLLETRQVFLPDNIGGNVLISPDWNTLYYCTSQAIHALDLQSSTPRMIRGHSVVSQTLTGLYLNGQILACQVSYDDGYSECLYLSTQTGSSCDTDRQLDRLYTDESTYLTTFRDGSVNLWLTGKRDSDPWMLNVSQNAEVLPLYASDALIVLEQTGSQTELSYLESLTGRRTGAITLDLAGEILHITGSDGIVWFLATDTASGDPLLYRWNPDWSRVWGPSSYYKPYYTAQNPNTAELLRLQYRANVLGERYGIHISIGEDVLQYQPSDCVFETEYRIAAYQRDLAVLESALSNFPTDFFKNAAFGTRNRKLTVSLLRGIYEGSRQISQPGKQYWLEESAYIALVMGEELERSFYHQLCHIIDNRVIGTSAVYDDWASLNPDGATYANSYLLDRIEAEEDWFSGDSRAFTDLYAMTYPREDRARLLEYAMTPGNSEVFASEIMQKKLSTLCLGIRQAFELDPSTAYLWEQYLIIESK